MKYVVLVSHGTFAPGLQSVLEMLAGGNRPDVISAGLEDGMSADEFAAKVADKLSVITADDEVILLADIVGGSPLTNAAAIVTDMGLAAKTICLGGMNLGMALTAVLMKDMAELEDLKVSLLDEAKNAIKEFPLVSDDDDDAEDDI